ncbi:MAG: hypothetical protein LQ338_007815 [Usnochroma carphineum]|nr:MAG: hypothetical protein LQ338_007815 [Usnochroma carphineum]
MHSAPRTIYDHDVDFAALAIEDPDFKKQWVLYPKFGRLSPSSAIPFALASRLTIISFISLKSNAQLDFSNPQAVQFNYILWVEDLLDTTSDDYREAYDPEREVVGLDICIYPLLGYIDDKNISYARQNILRNNLQSRIRPLHTKPEDPLIPLDALGIESIDFTLTNPPFYSSPTDLLSSAAAKSRPPHSACTGAPIEMVTPGGEVAFASRIIAESAVLRERVQWYTTMLGKLSSVGAVVEELKNVGCGNWAVKEFVQGGKTRRWGVGWSWGGRRPGESVARGVSSSIPKHLLPFPSQFCFEIAGFSLDDGATRLKSVLQSLDLQWKYKPQVSTAVGFAKANVWSRAARRQQMREGEEGRDGAEEESGGDQEGQLALGFKVQLLLGKEAKGFKVVVRWLLGRDSVLFESFCGMLRRRMGG